MKVVAFVLGGKQAQTPNCNAAWLLQSNEHVTWLCCLLRVSTLEFPVLVEDKQLCFAALLW
jgi:hypothetical protein